ncbi:hypothetical protein LTR28_012500 [Elasticomyces elasticus]|nr:hypothetical protein LTR28_012500 [Elasticomyces elasticus]
MASTSGSNEPNSYRKSSSFRRSSQSLQKTEIKINVYDLLPPGKLSSILWTLGGALLHSGVVIKGKEYAYGGHDMRGVSGVYWTRPQLEPSGGTFRCRILQGSTTRSEQEINRIVNEACGRFLGTSYNLLTNNCNHFTSYLCERLSSEPAPAWLNRAASIGLALPCVVPQEWVLSPDHDTADGELVEEGDDEQAAMLGSNQQRRWQEEAEEHDAHDESSGSRVASAGRIKDLRNRTPPPRLVSAKDTSGREMPASERAPVPRRN